MPAKKKLSPAQKAEAKKIENAGLRKLAIDNLASPEAITASDGKTKIYHNLYMVNAKGEYFVRETERRSKNKLAMKWRMV